jgi:hypothetical protein
MLTIPKYAVSAIVAQTFYFAHPKMREEKLYHSINGGQEHLVMDGQPSPYIFGSMLQRVIYHYWYHNGENMAIRQMLGNKDLGEFVGDIDGEAPYRPE